jgi:hypothetical protein
MGRRESLHDSMRGRVLACLEEDADRRRCDEVVSDEWTAGKMIEIYSRWQAC